MTRSAPPCCAGSAPRPPSALRGADRETLDALAEHCERHLDMNGCWRSRDDVRLTPFRLAAAGGCGADRAWRRLDAAAALSRRPALDDLSTGVTGAYPLPQIAAGCMTRLPDADALTRWRRLPPQLIALPPVSQWLPAGTQAFIQCLPRLFRRARGKLRLHFMRSISRAGWRPSSDERRRDAR